MSYILDALRKSEKERSAENIPTLSSVVYENKSQAWLKGALLVISIIAVAAVVYIVWLSSTDNAPDSRNTISSTASPKSATVAGESIAQTNAALVEVAGETNQSGTVETKTTVAYADLDPEFRAQLPPLTLNVVSFSRALDKRFVMLNQGIYKEGQTLASGVQVRKINESGVVLAYAGRTFFLTPN